MKSEQIAKILPMATSSVGRGYTFLPRPKNADEARVIFSQIVNPSWAQALIDDLMRPPVHIAIQVETTKAS